jgi:hypothetical protein
MPINHFKNNRLKVQKAFVDRNFLIPLTKDDLPLKIVEKNIKGVGKLKTVIIDNIPVSDKVRPLSYVLELELKGQLFSLPEKFRTVEKAIILLSDKAMYVVMIEMKSSIDPPTMRQIEEKIKHSIGRTLIFLTHYLLDENGFNEYNIQFHTLLLYNSDHLTKELVSKADPELEKSDLVRIFQGKSKSLIAKEPLGDEHLVNVIFMQNKKNADEFEIDFKKMFTGIINFDKVINAGKTLP